MANHESRTAMACRLLVLPEWDQQRNGPRPKGPVDRSKMSVISYHSLRKARLSGLYR
jgi:hypothetical protein